MIARIRGTLSEVRTNSVYLDLDDLTYQVQVPAVNIQDLQSRIGQRITLHTLQYIEGNSAFGNQVPRLAGFLTEKERDFFLRFIGVQGLGMNKGLRAMTLPVGEIAAAIEMRDAATLSKLPGIGKRTAEKMIAELHGKLGEFGALEQLASGAGNGPKPAGAVAPEIESEAVAALIQMGFRRSEAEEAVARAAAALGKADSVEQLVQQCFRKA